MATLAWHLCMHERWRRACKLRIAGRIQSCFYTTRNRAIRVGGRFRSRSKRRPMRLPLSSCNSALLARTEREERAAALRGTSGVLAISIYQLGLTLLRDFFYNVVFDRAVLTTQVGAFRKWRLKIGNNYSRASSWVRSYSSSRAACFCIWFPACPARGVTRLRRRTL